VCGCNYSMLRLRDQRPFLLGFTPPQDENHPRLFHSNQLNNAIGESLPASPLMRIGLVRPNRENRVEHEDPLSGPRFQIAIIRNLIANICMEFSIDVSQRERQRLNGGLYRKTEAMGMTRGWIGVLSNKQHTDLII